MQTPKINTIKIIILDCLHRPCIFHVEKSTFLIFYLKNTGTMDTVQNNDFNSDILEPSSVTFRIYLPKIKFVFVYGNDTHHLSYKLFLMSGSMIHKRHFSVTLNV
jgi:hypothetical protein